MKDEHVKAMVTLRCGDDAVEIEALFDTGAGRSFMSADVAAKFPRCLVALTKAYDIRLPKRDEKIAVTSRSNIEEVEVAGCKIPNTPFEVSPDLRDGTLIIGRPELDTWDVQFTAGGPRPKKCPVTLELI